MYRWMDPSVHESFYFYRSFSFHEGKNVLLLRRKKEHGTIFKNTFNRIYRGNGR